MSRNSAATPGSFWNIGIKETFLRSYRCSWFSWNSSRLSCVSHFAAFLNG